MAKQTINVGSTPNDGNGDGIRDSFIKVNDNFTELYSTISPNNYNVTFSNSVSIGTTISANVKVLVRSIGNTGNTYGLLVRNSNSMNTLYVRDDGVTGHSNNITITANQNNLVYNNIYNSNTEINSGAMFSIISGPISSKAYIDFYTRYNSGTPYGAISCGLDITNFYVIANSAGVYLPRNGTSWVAVSDERNKIIEEPIINGVDKVDQLRSVIGRYKEDSEDTRRPFLIAQDVQKVLPEAIHIEPNEDKTLGLSYTDIIPLLVSAIKELKQRVEELESRV